MAQMPVTFGAAHFHPAHPVRHIGMFGHSVWRNRGGKAGPARTGIIFAITGEQRIAASRAIIFPRFLVKIQMPGKGPLGAGFAQHMILFVGKALTPFGFGKV